ncbi:MAG: hypothetical protein ABSH06_09970 [Thermodesulfobacteriota bacterium]|jgi:DNA-binding Lrp family transcriptional regulator
MPPTEQELKRIRDDFETLIEASIIQRNPKRMGNPDYEDQETLKKAAWIRSRPKRFERVQEYAKAEQNRRAEKRKQKIQDRKGKQLAEIKRKREETKGESILEIESPALSGDHPEGVIPQPDEAVYIEQGEGFEEADETPGALPLEAAKEIEIAETAHSDFPVEDDGFEEVSENPRGWVKLYRKVLANPIFRDSETVHLFIYLLLKANREPKRFLFNKREILVERGQLITGMKKIGGQTGISQSKVRERLELLQNIGIITRKTTNKYSIITICNYEHYQWYDADEPQAKPHTKEESGISIQVGLPQHSDHNQTTIKPHQTRRYKKEENKESISHSDGVQEFLIHYGERLKFHLGVDPVIKWGKHGRLIKELLKTVPFEELKELLEAFFTSKDKFIRGSGYTIEVFDSQVQKLRVGTPGAHAGLKAWANEISEEEESGRER